MENVKVKKGELLKVLLKNRKNHRTAVEQAWKDYRVALIGLLDDKLKDAKAGKKIEHSISLYMPVDQTKEYDRAIRMLEMSVDKTIHLREDEFAQLVQDQWNWSAQFSTSNSSLRSVASTYLAKS